MDWIVGSIRKLVLELCEVVERECADDWYGSNEYFVHYWLIM